MSLGPISARIFLIPRFFLIFENKNSEKWQGFVRKPCDIFQKFKKNLVENGSKQ
jgi:hypothetical protein